MILNWAFRTALNGGGLGDTVWSVALQKFVGTQGSDASHAFYESVDGITWTVHATTGVRTPARMVYNVALGKFVAIGVGDFSNQTVCWSSTDGTTWTRTVDSSSMSTRMLATSEDLGNFICGGVGGAVFYSTDGHTWTFGQQISTGGGTFASAVNDAVWSHSLGIYCAIITRSSTDHVTATSSDGVTWTSHIWSGHGGVSGVGFDRIEWSEDLGLFCMVGRGSGGSGGGLATSPDGVNWTLRTPPSVPPAGYGNVRWIHSTGVFVAAKYGPLAWSDDLQTIIGTSESSGSTPTAFSTDGINWTAGGSTPTTTGVMSGAVGPSLSPTTSRDRGDVTVRIVGDGSNGGFTNQAGVNFGVVFYPFSALGLSAPDFVTNYPLGGGYVFGLLASNVTWVDAYTLTCTPPHGCGDGRQYGLAPGPISVDVAVFDLSKVSGNPNCQFYQAASFTYVDPVMLSVSPTHGTVLGGETVTITGSNFYPDEGLFLLGSNLVRFGQAIAFCTYVSPTQLTCVAPVFYGDVDTDPLVDLVFEPSRLSAATALSPLASFGPAATTLLDAYTYTAVWWVFDPTLGFDFEFYDLAWEDFDFGYGIGSLGVDQFTWYYYALSSPGSGWTSTTAPDPNGWWMSIEGFAGSVLVVANSRPKDPRTWSDFVAFATGTAAMLGGSPGYGCVLGNKLVYAATGYTVGTNYPPIRIFDGSFDRELCTLPPTNASAVPKAIVSMLAANGTIYLSTLDTGSSSSDWVGRVFQLDIETATLTPVGAAFTTGHVPYALAWHNGRLYCGTHRQVSTAVGKIYSILPGVDTAWTEDYDLASASMAGVASMLSFQGTLFVGCTAAAGTFAKVIKRATDGTYSTAETGSGGTAKANNGFLSLAEFSGTIYAGYWNNDTTAITSIRKSSDGTTWSVSFSGATTTLRPIIALFVDNGVLYAIGGGLSLTAAILSTPDGVTWTNLTAQLPDTGETALPVFGVVVF